MNIDYKARERALYDQLKRSPVVDVTGILGPGGSSGHGGAEPDEWCLMFSFAAWKQGDDRIRHDQLIVRHPGLTQGQLKQFMSELNPYAIVRVSAKLAEDSIYGRPEALLVEIIHRNFDDPELVQVAASLQAPKTFTDPKLGEFFLDRKVDWYEGQADWCGASVKLHLQVDEKDQPEQPAEFAHHLWQDQVGWHDRVLDCAVKELLETANEWWSEHNDGTLSAQDFKSRINLESITVHPDGRFDFWFDDGDLFWGHSIEVRGSLADGPTEASIVG
jgi:hypothetical protein